MASWRRSPRDAARFRAACAEPTYCVGCIDPDDAGGPTTRTSSALVLREARRNGEGAGARTPPVEGPAARPLSGLGPVRRQSRGSTGGEPRLFRQGAGPPLAGTVRFAGRDPALAGTPASRPAP